MLCNYVFVNMYYLLTLYY